MRSIRSAHPFLLATACASSAFAQLLTPQEHLPFSIDSEKVVVTASVIHSTAEQDGGVPPVPQSPDIARIATELEGCLAAPPQAPDILRGLARCLAAPDTYKAYWRFVQLHRRDQRITASAGAGAATSLATPGGAAEVIATAIESGAVTQTLSQNVLTFTTNAEALWEFVRNEEVVDCTKDKDNVACKSAASNLALSASFNVSNGGTQTLTGTLPGSSTSQTITLPASTRQFSSATAQYAVLNGRAPTTKDAHGKWLQSTKKVFSQLPETHPLIKYLERQTKIPPGTHAIPAYFNFEVLIAQIKSSAEFKELQSEAVRAYASQLSLDDLPKNDALSLLYTFSEPTAEPELHNFKLAWQTCPPTTCKTSAAKGDFTLNVGFDIYNKAQPNTKGGQTYFRDAQAAIDWTRGLGASNIADLSFAGYFQYQISPAAISLPAGTVTPGGITLPGQAATLLAPKGFMGIAEVKTTIKIGNSGTEVPIGLTWSNRTDLIKANEVRGHIGFTWDTSSLFSLNKR